MYKVMIGEYERPRARRPDLPEGLENLIARAMALSPGERPSGAAVLEKELLAYCRPTFREHTIEVISSQFPRLTPFPQRTGGAVIPHGAGVGTGTDQTILARSATQPKIEVAAVAAEAARGRSRAPLIAAALVVVGAAAAVIAVVANRSHKVPAAPVVGAVAPPALAPAPPPPPAPAPALAAAPAQPPAVVAPPPVPIVTPLPPATITLRFEIEPPSAKVELDGTVATGAELAVPKDGAHHHLHITAAGFAPHDEDLTYDESQRLAIHLDKAASPNKPSKAGKPAAPAHVTPKPPGDRDERIETQSPY
jgi:hypothetical protein